MTIDSMDRHKGGTYICSANNGVGNTASTQVNLHVLCEYRKVFVCCYCIFFHVCNQWFVSLNCIWWVGVTKRNCQSISKSNSRNFVFRYTRDQWKSSIRVFCFVWDVLNFIGIYVWGLVLSVNVYLKVTLFRKRKRQTERMLKVLSNFVVIEWVEWLNIIWLIVCYKYSQYVDDTIPVCIYLLFVW